MYDFVKSQVDVLNSTYHKLHVDLLNLWISHMLFSWRWWIALAILICPITLWFIFRDKRRTYSLLIAGLFTIITSVLLDNLGMALGIWSYPINVIPIVPPYLPWDFAMLPVVTMFTIQYFPNLSPKIKAVIFSLAGSFIFQPLMEWIGLYDPKYWKHYYSFLFLVIIYLIANRLYEKAELEKNRHY